MTILVTGANGQLGNEMRIVAADSADRYIFTDVIEVEGLPTTHLDITDAEAVREIVKREHVDAIVNCAAYTNVDAAESNEALAELLNATAPEILAKAMAEVGGLLIHISTDYVFGQEPYNTPCREDQQGTPTGVYGLTKKHGEQKIMEVFDNAKSSPFKGDRRGSKRGSYIIIRTAWLYSEFGKNFCKTMLHLTATKPSLNVVFDQVGTPTYALDLAKAICTILRNPVEGIYHYSNEGVCSWYDFTKMIQQIALEVGYYDHLPSRESGEGLQINHLPLRETGEGLCDIRPCHSCEFPSPVKRPAYSVLDKTKIKETFSLTIPYWTDSLKVCIKQTLLTSLKGRNS